MILQQQQMTVNVDLWHTQPHEDLANAFGCFSKSRPQWSNSAHKAEMKVVMFFLDLRLICFHFSASQKITRIACLKQMYILNPYDILGQHGRVGKAFVPKDIFSQHLQ